MSPPGSIYTQEGEQSESRNSTPDVSPVEECPSPLALHVSTAANRGSSIPVPRHSCVAGAASSSRRGKGASSSNRDSLVTATTRWDDFSGEPTTSEAGKLAQAIPGALHFTSQPSQERSSSSFGNHISKDHGATQALRRMSNHHTDQVFTPREAWKGASGRHTIVNPLLDKPLPAGVSPSFRAGSRRNSAEAKGKTISRGPQDPKPTQSTQNDVSQLTEPRENNSSIAPLAYPNTSLKNNSATANQPELYQASCSEPLTLVSTNSSSSTGRMSKAAIEDAHSLVLPAATPDSKIEKPELIASEDDFRAKMHYMHLEDQLPSRFSATTSATTAFDSPPATPEMNMESPTATPPSSILNRKRPVPAAAISSAKLAARKPTPLEVRKSNGLGSGDRCHSKSLPKSPPEAQAVTRVASLEAQRDNLRRRRINLQTVIHELTNVIQPSSIAYDMASRREIKRTVNGLNVELTEVVKEEHETGLKLHRAYKRHDENSAYENSFLWVKRLAS